MPRGVDVDLDSVHTHRKSVIHSEWAKIGDARSNNIFAMVKVKPSRETNQLQQIFGVNTEHVCL
jgi:hypothetical protein